MARKVRIPLRMMTLNPESHLYLISVFGRDELKTQMRGIDGLSNREERRPKFWPVPSLLSSGGWSLAGSG